MVLAAEVFLLFTFSYNQKLPVLLTAAVVILMLILDNPVWAVGLMLAGRLLSTGTLSFFTIGKMSIGLFEPVLLLALVVLGLRAVFEQKKLWREWPWQLAYGLILGWNALGLFWCQSVSDGVKEIIGLCIIVATNFIIIAFIETWEDVKLMLWFWILSCALIGILSIFGDQLGLTSYATQWKAAAGGGRSTGLGQQPNWFSMNLMFVVQATAAFALIQRERLLRWGLLVCSLFIFLTQMSSGSRGGAYSIVIGAAIVALGQPVIRKWLAGFSAVGGVVFGVALLGNLGAYGRALNRISMNLDQLFARDIRGMNWAACGQMFLGSDGLGIGPGGYVDYLRIYNWWLYNSVYRYPHGIFWGQMAHGGIIGILLLVFLVVAIGRMCIQTIRDTAGTEASGIAWAMTSSMVGYFAWSFVEFNFNEKPFWEWLALMTALHLVARKAKEGQGPAIPAFDASSIV